MTYSYAELAGMIDHALLHPAMTDAEAEAGCRMAAAYGVATVCVKPCFVARAAELLRGSRVRVGSVVGFPAGNSTSEIKLAEAERACRDGAAEIDMVIHIGKALAGDWDYVEREIRTLADAVHRHGALLKVIFETDYLPEDAAKIRLCEICGRAGADWVKTSTGFGFVRQADGSFATRGATEHDLRLMRRHSPPQVQVKASGGVRDLDGLIRVRELGCTRLGTSATAAILDEYRRRAAAGAGAPAVTGAAELGGSGY